jgi:hypothetical protein
MGWALELYHPILKNGFKKWMDTKGADRKTAIEQTITNLQKIHAEAVVTKKDLPGLPDDLHKARLTFLSLH